MFEAAWVGLLSALLFAAKPEVASAITVSDVRLSNGFVSRSGITETFYCNISNVDFNNEGIYAYGISSLPNGLHESRDPVQTRHQCVPNGFLQAAGYDRVNEYTSSEIVVASVNTSKQPDCVLFVDPSNHGSLTMTITLEFNLEPVGLPRKWRCFVRGRFDGKEMTKKGPETTLTSGVVPLEVTHNVTERGVHLTCSTAPSNPPVEPQYVQWLNSDMEVVGKEFNTTSAMIRTERTGFVITRVEVRVDSRLCSKSSEFFCRVILPCCNASVSSETLKISCPGRDGHTITQTYLGSGITLSSNWTVPSMEHERFSLIRVLLSVFVPMIKCLDIISAIVIYVLCMRKPRKTVDFEDARQHCTGIEAIISTLLLLTIGLGPFTFGIYCRNKKRIDAADAAVFPESKDELLYNDPNELTMPGDAGYIDTRERRIAHQDLQQPKYATDTLSSGSTSDSSPATERQIGVITIVYEDLDV